MQTAPCLNLFVTYCTSYVKYFPGNATLTKFTEEFKISFYLIPLIFKFKILNRIPKFKSNNFSLMDF